MYFILCWCWIFSINSLGSTSENNQQCGARGVPGAMPGERQQRQRFGMAHGGCRGGLAVTTAGGHCHCWLGWLIGLVGLIGLVVGLMVGWLNGCCLFVLVLVIFCWCDRRSRGCCDGSECGSWLYPLSRFSDWMWVEGELGVCSSPHFTLEIRREMVVAHPIRWS